MDKPRNYAPQTRYRAKLHKAGHAQINVILKPDTLAALDRLKTAHGTRQAAIEHAIHTATITARLSDWRTFTIPEQRVINQDK